MTLAIRLQSFYGWTSHFVKSMVILFTMLRLLWYLVFINVRQHLSPQILLFFNYVISNYQIKWDENIYEVNNIDCVHVFLLLKSYKNLRLIVICGNRLWQNQGWLALGQALQSFYIPKVLCFYYQLYVTGSLNPFALGSTL